MQRMSHNGGGSRVRGGKRGAARLLAHAYAAGQHGDRQPAADRRLARGAGRPERRCACQGKQGRGVAGRRDDPRAQSGQRRARERESSQGRVVRREGARRRARRVRSAGRRRQRSIEAGLRRAKRRGDQRGHWRRAELPSANAARSRASWRGGRCRRYDMHEQQRLRDRIDAYGLLRLMRRHTRFEGGQSRDRRYGVGDQSRVVQRLQRRRLQVRTLRVCTTTAVRATFVRERPLRVRRRNRRRRERCRHGQRCRGCGHTELR